MTHDDDPKPLSTGRLGRFAKLARAGLGTAASVVVGSSSGIENAVERLSELRGMGTKLGQMAGLVEASLAPDVRAKVGPALARLRAQAARSPYADVARIVEEDLGAPPEALFARFERAPFASASLGQVHEAVHLDGRRLAVKVQHPGIREAFAQDLANVTALGRIPSTFFFPEGQSRAFLDGVSNGFLAELDYVREAQNQILFAHLVAGDEELRVPEVIVARSSGRVLTTTFLEGTSVELARTWDVTIRRRHAAAVRRLVVSALVDHGVLYADAHAGNFLFRPDGTVGVLDFGSIFRLAPDEREAFGAMRDAALAEDRVGVVDAVLRAFGAAGEPRLEPLAAVVGLAFAPLVRGDAITDDHVRALTSAATEMKKKMLGVRVGMPPLLPFLMRAVAATLALLAGLDAGASGRLERLPGAWPSA